MDSAAVIEILVGNYDIELCKVYFVEHSCCWVDTGVWTINDQGGPRIDGNNGIGLADIEEMDFRRHLRNRKSLLRIRAFTRGRV